MLQQNDIAFTVKTAAESNEKIQKLQDQLEGFVTKAA